MVPAHTRKLIVSLMEGQAAMSHSRFLREEEPLPSISSAAGVLGDASDGDEQAVLQQRELVRVHEVPQGALCGGGWWVGGLVGDCGFSSPSNPAEPVRCVCCA